MTGENREGWGQGADGHTPSAIQWFPGHMTKARRMMEYPPRAVHRTKKGKRTSENSKRVRRESSMPDQERMPRTQRLP